MQTFLDFWINFQGVEGWVAGKVHCTAIDCWKISTCFGRAQFFLPQNNYDHHTKMEVVIVFADFFDFPMNGDHFLWILYMVCLLDLILLLKQDWVVATSS